ncbi:MAG: type II secretion system protein GspK [Thermodesulfovibrionia bacterium]|nr:type II secretion system protein GspK [Thermodesulfovibrionia bacterium]
MNNRKFLYSENLLKNERGGVALILVLWVMVILTAIVGEFAYSMRTELNITRNFKEEEESYQLALAGIESAKMEILLAKNSLYVYLTEDGILVFKKEKEEEIPERKGELGKGTFSYTITDEEGKLNINTAPPEQIKSIIISSGVDVTDVDTIGDSIIDWRDTNNLHMLNGAEEDYYQSLENPYSSKDGPFDSIDELLLVKGVTPEIFYGSRKEGEDEEKSGEDEKKEYEGIAQYFTPWGSGQLNINTAPQKVLEAVFGAAQSENFIKQREAGVQQGNIVPSIFTITSTGTTIDGKIKRTIKTTIRREGNKLKTLYWDDNFIL